MPSSAARYTHTGEWVSSIQKNGNASTIKPTEPMAYTTRRPMMSDSQPQNTMVPASTIIATITLASTSWVSSPVNLA
ncbi:hypothetical protein D3C80_1079680 [compost metagenome]